MFDFLGETKICNYREIENLKEAKEKMKAFLEESQRLKKALT